jgi:hypothetical protein
VKIRQIGSLVTLAVLVAACGGEDFLVDWEENPLEQVLYSLDREPEGTLRQTAFNMLERRGLVIEDPVAQGRWDFAVDREAGRLVLLPPQALGVTSRAAIARIPGTTFANVIEAPSDTLVYSTNQSVPVELGTVYVIRTHQQPGFFGQFCFFFGKIEPIEIDVEAGILRFLHDVSPDCNNRSLVPPT